MTTLNIPPARLDGVLAGVNEAGVRPPTSVFLTPSTPLAIVSWTPDLSAAEQTTVASIVTLSLGATLISPAERTALEPDIAGLRTYQGIASPTLAQTVAAVKAQSRVLRALLRDG